MGDRKGREWGWGKVQRKVTMPVIINNKKSKVILKISSSLRSKLSHPHNKHFSFKVYKISCDQNLIQQDL